MTKQKTKGFCMFDNMTKDNRVIVNALCEFDPLEEWRAWNQDLLVGGHLLKKLIKYKPTAEKPSSFARIILVQHKGRKIKIDLSNGDVVGAFTNTKFKEGEHVINGFSIFNHHQTSKFLLLNRRIEITIPSFGKIILATHNRAVSLDLEEEAQKNLDEASARGALVSELCAKEIPKLSTILPLQKGQDEIDYANKILENKWLQLVKELAAWKEKYPKDHSNEKWIKEEKKEIPPPEPLKVSW